MLDNVEESLAAGRHVYFVVRDGVCRCVFRCMLMTSDHAGVEGFIIKNIKNQIDLALKVRRQRGLSGSLERLVWK